MIFLDDEISNLENEKYELREEIIYLKDEISELKTELHETEEENEKLITWINDLQSGMYINCVYCGHRYGPQENTPCSMADVLKEHIEHCPKHPMSELKKQNKLLTERLKNL